MLGELLATMLNVIGFSWEASPGATELEILVMGEFLVGRDETVLAIQSEPKSFGGSDLAPSSCCLLHVG